MSDVDVDIKKIISEIKMKTENEVLNKLQTGQLVNPEFSQNCNNVTNQEIERSQKVLVSIMQKGVYEFEQKVGRPITKTEMFG